MKRLEILKNSLEKKEAKQDDNFNSLYKHQAMTHGSPVNDKRGGGAWFNAHEKINDSIRNQYASIEKTKQAIEREQKRLARNEDAREMLLDYPQAIIDLVEAGTLIQWNKYPNTFFVNGLDKIRIIYEKKELKTKITETLYHKYGSAFASISTKEQIKYFNDLFNELKSKVNKITKK
jgi:hypothetical protein